MTRQLKDKLLSLFHRLGWLPFIFSVRPWLSAASPKVLYRSLPYWLRGTPDRLPLPAARARFLVTGSADIPWFLESGSMAAEGIQATLRRNGLEIEKFRRILDFGCGCGRILRHWHGLEGTSIHGADQEPLLVDEAIRTLPFAQVINSNPDPPLPYPDESFDLVYAYSVFTHLGQDLQRAWRDEIRRILAPGGVWLLTTHGKHYLSHLTKTQQAEFRAGNVICRRPQYRGQNLCIAYHPEKYVRKVLGEGFCFLDYLPEGAAGSPYQDMFLLRRNSPSAEERPKEPRP